MVISSLVVEVVPGKEGSVAKALNAMEGVEVHEANGYKLVVTIEAPSMAAFPWHGQFVSGRGRGDERDLVYANFEDENLGREGR